jgi:hypothetical protein
MILARAMGELDMVLPHEHVVIGWGNVNVARLKRLAILRMRGRQWTSTLQQDWQHTS